MKENYKKIKAWLLYVMDHIFVIAGGMVAMFYVCVAAGETSHSYQGKPSPSIPQILYIVSWWTIGCVSIYLVFRLIYKKLTKTNQVNEHRH